ncbi:tetratricopeptide repeat protein [Methanobrevibacter sp.]
MDEWKVGDPPDWGDSVGVPDIPYMGYIDDYDDSDDDFRIRPGKSRAESLVEEAWELRMQGRYNDAVAVASAAISEDDQLANAYNVRAIARQDLGKFEFALIDFNRALELYDSQIIKNNKAGLLHMMSNDEKYFGNLEKALELINEALKLTDIDNDRMIYLTRKGEILDRMGRNLDARICYLLSAEKYDMVDELERQSEIIHDPNETYISISATNLFDYDKPLTDGMVVTLQKDPDNERSADSILVKHKGEPVGYVSNASYMLPDGIKAASEIKEKMKDNQKAEILFTYLDAFLVAKFI